MYVILHQSGFMDKIGSFVNIKQHNLRFHGCSTCEGQCCNGTKGFAAAPLILEDFKEVYQRFPIVFSIKEQKLVAYMLLNDGKGYCQYYSKSANQCSIYEQRPPACKLYPISPYFEHVLVDTDCVAVQPELGETLCRDGVLNKAFATQRLDNFVAKLDETRAFLESIYAMGDFEYIGNLLGIPLFKYARSSDNPYITMHLESLQHFWHYIRANLVDPARAVS